ncbi:hypothetical protein AB204_20515 [Xenorhabdus khoisanae]|uniref:Phage tail protein n=1 Tax=Xenorhabdus khoisanae TaxID=880157 RepID=A0A0J5FMT0_9GAMM|nr:hypothetical protein [Xenorhabdus khoisanae]KMJ43292.1 hypothetical protein AB204_20515 [Xenorhabdus khoisanae]
MTKTFKVPFAAQGDRVAIPDEVQPNGAVSYAQGYGAEYGRDQNEDPTARDIEREKMNGIFHDITEAVGEMQAFGAAQWSNDAQPYPLRALVYHKQKVWQSRIENNKEEPTIGSAWVELKADLTADDAGAYSKEESDQRFQPKGNYQPVGNYALKGDSYTKTESDNKYQPLGNYLTAGYSYSKNESDNRYQQKGNYAPARNYALKGESYTKPESDAKYQSKGNYQPVGNYQHAGNYALRGESYTKQESDSRYQVKGIHQRWRKIGDFGGAAAVAEAILSENCLGQYLFVQRYNTGNNTVTGFLVPPVSGLRFCVPMGRSGYWDFIVSSDGRKLSIVGSEYGSASGVYMMD